MRKELSGSEDEKGAGKRRRTGLCRQGYRADPYAGGAGSRRRGRTGRLAWVDHLQGWETPVGGLMVLESGLVLDHDDQRAYKYWDPSAASSF